MDSQKVVHLFYFIFVILYLTPSILKVKPLIQCCFSLFYLWTKRVLTRLESLKALDKMSVSTKATYRARASDNLVDPLRFLTTFFLFASAMHGGSLGHRQE